MIFDQQVYLNPIFKDLKYLAKGLREAFQHRERLEATQKRFECIKNKIVGQVQELAMAISSATNPASVLYPGAIAAQSPLDTFSSSMNEIIREYGNTGMTVEIPMEEHQNPMAQHLQRVRDELDRYMAEPGVMTLAGDPLKWWFSRKNDYPILSRASRIVFSVPAGAGPMELDIGHTGMIVTKQRTSLAGDIVEALTMANRNRGMIDLVNVDLFTPVDLKEKLPKDLAMESTLESATILGALDVHLPSHLHDSTSEMLDSIAVADDEE